MVSNQAKTGSAFDGYQKTQVALTRESHFDFRRAAGRHPSQTHSLLIDRVE
jgi:hypothetical protein